VSTPKRMRTKPEAGKRPASHKPTAKRPQQIVEGTYVTSDRLPRRKR